LSLTTGREVRYVVRLDLTFATARVGNAQASGDDVADVLGRVVEFASALVIKVLQSSARSTPFMRGEIGAV
jgi:hypothetical protein